MVNRTDNRNIFALETLQDLVFSHLQTDTNEVVITCIIIQCSLKAKSCLFSLFFPINSLLTITMSKQNKLPNWHFYYK